MWIAISNAVGQRVGTGGGPGPGPDPGYTPPLDTFTGAAVAYSLRKLRTDYAGPCIEAYRVSDGATQDIGFASTGLIDTTAIASFASGSEVTVKTWYDQTSTGADLTKTDTANLPTIYDGTSVVTRNGLPVIAVSRVANTGPGDWLSTSFQASTDGTQEFFTISSEGSNGGDRFFWDSNGGSGNRWGSNDTNTFFAYQNKIVNHGLSSDDMMPWGGFTDASIDAVRSLNAIQSSAARLRSIRTTTDTATLGARYGGNEGYNAFRISELIHYPTAQASNRIAITVNQNSYWKAQNIVSNSGFLSTYSGAKAAYSVRKLGDGAVYCMTVRRNAAPFDSKVIGFDSDGLLDVQAIEDFGGTDELQVALWWDQSGGGNHMQGTSASQQPVIYDGTEVKMLNGKPCLDFDHLETDTMRTVTSSITGLTDSNGEATFSFVYNPRLNIGSQTVWDLESGTRILRFTYANTGIDTLFLSYGTGEPRANGTRGAGLVTGYYDGTEYVLRLNGVEDGTSASAVALPQGGTRPFIGSRIGSGQFMNAQIQELIHWGSDKSGDVGGFESDIMTYYGL